ncbi:MAG: pilus assembly protein PilC [Omnitrophica bacterium RIFCSPLOWO2_02_FULL_45_16]|nr:MAG: pilus assembly protein PilC [Omnitrophica bacterium RIFCSPLOWO2_12_FULL_45_13]OGW94520.1 MAG: pilus assembly protein PilC [Omnitrophica bacterium RIFCSPLOWO2_01_FULL_45_24]OGW99998.1 MAG: pilus assembly protein PilC [Omnitrophica bacterium RIFCSPLOWO2_02_FULL_45_16]
MANFKYIAKDSEGKSLSGFFEAADYAAAIDALRKKGLIIVSVNEALSKLKFSMPLFGKKKIKMDDLVVFSRQLATMVDAGIPLVGALDILGEQAETKTFGEIILKMRNDVETGSSLSDALAKHKKVFSPLFINMVKAGESGGMLDNILDRLATYMEKTSTLQKKIKSALIYPAVVSSMAIGITLILLLKVIPIFKNIFSGFDADLPIPTQVLITISDGLQKYFPYLIVALAVIMFFAIRYSKTEKGRLRYDSFLLKLPIFGILFKKVAISKFTRTLSTLIKSGVPILTSLEIVGRTAGNKAIEMAVETVRASVREGESVAGPLAKSKLFPPMVVRMVSVGEQSGELEKMLSKIADFYDEQVDVSVSSLTSLIEPLIIAFLGIVIGSIVICMFLPIFKITSVMGG